MNDLQKKSLIFSIILAVEYFFIARIPQAFVYLFVALLISVTFFCLYFYKITREDRESYKFLILPILFNFGASYFISTINFLALRFILAGLIVVGNFYLFQAIKKVQNLKEKAAIFYRNLIISLTFITLLLTLSAIFKTYVLLSTSVLFSYLPIFVVILVAAIFYFLSYFLAWEYGINSEKFFPYNLVGTLLAAEISLVGIIWVVNYPVFSTSQKASLGGLPLPAVLLTMVFYFVWGVISHKMDKSLSRKIMTEYLLITFLFVLVLLATTRWLPGF